MARGLARLTLIIGVLMMVVLGHTPASAGYGKRFALVIGNSNYEGVQKLPNAAHDAKDIAKALEALKFRVFSGIDLDAQEFSKLVEEFREEAAGADTVVFYYAGHGFQLDNSNYLVPVDAQLKSRDAIDKETLALNGIIARIHNYNRQTIIFLDACRNNPIPAGQDDEPTLKGLAQLQTGDGTFIAFATQPGNVSVDGSAENSPFARALLDHIGTPMITISDLMIKVRNDVKNATMGKQTPWDQSSLSQQFSFKPEVQVATTTPTVRITGVEDPNGADGRDITVTGTVSSPDAGTRAEVKPSITVGPPGEGGDKVQMTALDPDNQRNAIPPQVLEASALGGRDLNLGIQKQLKRLNCLSGDLDGKWGNNTTGAIDSVNRRTGLQLSSIEAKADTLLELKSLSGPLCVIRCRSNQKLQDGVCVARTKPTKQEKTVKQSGKGRSNKPVAKNESRKRPVKKKTAARKPVPGTSGVTVGSGVGIGSFF